MWARSIDILYALDTGNGNIRWSKATAEPPAIAYGKVYCGGASDGKVYARDTATGNILCTYPTGGIIGSLPTIANGLLFIGSSDEKIYGFDAQTGGRQWFYQTGGTIVSQAITKDTLRVTLLMAEHSKLFSVPPVLYQDYP